jgi:hypothetical protein
MKKNKGTVSLLGQMADAIKANGKMGNKMEKAFIVINKVFKDLGSGRMERKLNGQIDINLLWL